MSDTPEAIYVGSETGAPENKLYFELKWGNRHGLIAGATGTGENGDLARFGRRFFQCRRAGFYG